MFYNIIVLPVDGLLAIPKPVAVLYKINFLRVSTLLCLLTYYLDMTRIIADDILLNVQLNLENQWCFRCNHKLI